MPARTPIASASARIGVAQDKSSQWNALINVMSRDWVLPVSLLGTTNAIVSVPRMRMDAVPTAAISIATG